MTVAVRKVKLSCLNELWNCWCLTRVKVGVM